MSGALEIGLKVLAAWVLFSFALGLALHFASEYFLRRERRRLNEVPCGKQRIGL